MEFFVKYWEVLFAILSPIAAWVVGRRRKEAQLKKEQAEAKELELGSVSSNFKIYQDVINDLEVRFKKRIEELEADLERMKTLNEELRKMLSGQEKYIKRLTAKVEKYEKLENQD